MAFDNFCIKSRLTGFTFTLMYDWLAAHVASIVHVREVINLRTLSLYAELYAFAPVGYFTLTRDGTIRRANLTGAKLLNMDISELIRRRFEVFVELESQRAFREFLARVFLNEKKQACEVPLELGDGAAQLWVYIEAVTNQTSLEQDICYAIVSDIAERKRVEEELRKLSIHDMLTGLYNHGFFLAELARLQ
ncbi:MAG: PAS domain-containing protein [Bacteroidota bacterium]